VVNDDTRKDILMQINLKGKVALVTGASRGLGRAIALALGKAGATVAVTDILLEGDDIDRGQLQDYSPLAGHFAGTDAVKTRATAQEIIAEGGRSIAVRMDVTDAESVNEAIKTVNQSWGSIDILINNAVVMDNFGKLEGQDPKKWDRDVNVNLSGAFRCTKAAWPTMVRNAWGRIVNVSSIAGLMGAWEQPSYGATKAGLIGLTKSLAIEGGKHNITVNVVCPGFIETEAVGLCDDGMKERVRKRTALRRLGKPQEVADLAVFLSSPAASYITGAVIPVTGGMDLLIF